MDFKITADFHPSSSELLDASDFCDSQTPLITRAVRNIIGGATEDRARARRVFYWVRDSIKYELGLNQDRASETLAKGVGSCSNKANLFVAMMRNLGIPAGFHIMYVQGKVYCGSVCSPRFNIFMGAKSIHAYCSVYLGGEWVQVDPTDDIRFSNGIQHLCPQATPVDFDGYRNARLHLDPNHIIEDSGQLLPSLDSIFQKKRRVPDVAIQVFNRYMDYLRQHCIWFDEPSAIEAEFFQNLRLREPVLYHEYERLSEEVTNTTASLVTSPVATSPVVISSPAASTNLATHSGQG